MTVRINKQKINLREKLTEFEDKVNFDEVIRGLGEYDGNVGIGTTNPGYKLDIAGTGVQRLKVSCTDNNVNGAGLYLVVSNSDTVVSTSTISTTNSGVLRFFTGTTVLNESEKMRITSGGNVGIGTTDPDTYKLYINGTARVSGGDVTSDDRVKHNEQAIVGAIEILGKITPKKYIKTTEMYEANHDFELDADGNPVDADGEPVEHSIEAGVIAQQVLEVPELAFMVSPEGVDEDGNVTSPHGLNYNSLFTYAIAAIQEQQSIIEDLKSRIETLESK